MISNRLHFLRASVALLLAVPAFGADYKPVHLAPPNPVREFRAAWAATVGNIDWPSRNDLSVPEQKAELVAILDRAVQLRLNAIIFQVRPACDALYASQLEPWSEYLTGTMGKPPQPIYDPLAFAIEEAHKRGLELHAWFNPYRARHANAKSDVSASHISKTKPHLVRQYGPYLWLDPGEKEVQDYSLRVVMDVAKQTVNVRADIPFGEFAATYRRAYALGLKGCTVYRPNAVTGAVLSALPMAERCCDLPGGN